MKTSRQVGLKKNLSRGSRRRAGVGVKRAGGKDKLNPFLIASLLAETLISADCRRGRSPGASCTRSNSLTLAKCNATRSRNKGVDSHSKPAAKSSPPSFTTPLANTVGILFATALLYARSTHTHTQTDRRTFYSARNNGSFPAVNSPRTDAIVE